MTNQALGQVGPEYINQLLGFVQGKSPEELQQVFQQAYVEPAMQTFQQQAIPSIMQAYGDVNAGSSSALNQALAQSASDLSTSLGSQYGQLYNMNQQNQLASLGLFNPMLNQQTYQPVFSQSPGILPGLLSAGGQIGAGYFGGRR